MLDNNMRKVCSGWRRFPFCLLVVCFLTYLLSVLELKQQQQTIQDLHRQKYKKFDHLVLGPAAGKGLPDRLQCQGMKALNRTQFSTSSNNSDKGEDVAFVTVFTTYNSSADGQANGGLSNLVTVGNASYNKVDRSLAILNVFINFIQVILPQSNIIILTDPSSELPVHRNRVFVHPIQGIFRNKN